ncbi:unnamed protein product [Sphagnum jensenii]|uniref:RRM domain-containing protein n=1 Tax=Sphagnum jensenii TaxID=128206 RepID=A0ABP1B3K1_9BRYO
MTSALDMSLDDMIKTNKQVGRRGGGGGGRGGGRRAPGSRGSFNTTTATTGGYGSGPKAATGPVRRQMKRTLHSGHNPYSTAAKASKQASPFQHNMYEDMVPNNMLKPLSLETGSKLYISNLDYGVSNEDLKELFAEVGELKRCSIHYDRSGRSKGTAEVVFARKTEAVAAMKRYNTVQLDGKPMQIELIGTIPSNIPGRDLAVAGGAGLVVQAANGARPNSNARRVVLVGGGTQGRGSGGRRGSSRNFRGRGRGRGAGRSQGRVQAEEKSAEDLDAELETYHAEAMQM